jgi:hypothetical protein
MDKSFLKNDPELSQWVLQISSGRGESEESDTFSGSLFPSRPIKSNSYLNWNRRQLSSVYLIDDFDANKLKNRGCILLGEPGEELNILIKLFCDKDYDFHCLYDLQKSFFSWEQLIDDNQILPCTDIIINDRYLFKNDYELVKYNLNQMLKALVNNVKNKINIVLFTRNDSLSDFGIEKAKDIIKTSIEETTNIRSNVTFVTSNNNTLIPHDRFIITNYRLIRSGDSFVYFNTKGEKITNGGALDIDSIANYHTYIFVESLLESLQKNYNEIYRVNKDRILGNKVSNFIAFNE